jgi:hypothetical protein
MFALHLKISACDVSAIRSSVLSSHFFTNTWGEPCPGLTYSHAPFLTDSVVSLAANTKCSPGGTFLIPWKRGDAVNESRSMPARAFGGRFSSKMLLLMVVGDMLEPDNSSSNQFWRKILEGMVMVLLDSRYEVMGIMKCRNGVLRWARARQSYQQLLENKKQGLQMGSR